MVADYETAKTKAKQLLVDANITSFPVNLATILNYLDLNVEYSCDIEEEALLDPLKKTIFLKKDDKPIARKLFSVAHEIGHWMLHSHDKTRNRIDISKPNISTQDKIEEQEANAFGAELLMPYNKTRLLIMCGYQVNDLVKYFNVSYEFAYFRYSHIYGMIYQ